MNVVDSSGWLEYLTDGSNAAFFAAPIQDIENLLTPTICLYEVFKRVLLEFGEEKALEIIGNMTGGAVIDLTHSIAIEAAMLSAELKLALADSVILATAREHDATLWTQDVHFKGMANVEYIEKRY